MNVDDRVLEQNYREGLEERIIAHLSEKYGLTLERAMDIYYSSRLADRIFRGTEGVQYLDCKVLAQILYETEPALFISAKEEEPPRRSGPAPANDA